MSLKTYIMRLFIIPQLCLIGMSACAADDMASSTFSVPDAAPGYGANGEERGVRPDTDSTARDAQGEAEELCASPLLPCSCADAEGWAPCVAGEPGVCRCDGLCPGAETSIAQGQLNSTLTAPFVGRGELRMTHRLATGDWSCINSARLRFSAQGQDSDGCAIEFETSPEVGPTGGLKITAATWDADALCLGLSEGARGRYTAIELGASEVVFDPSTTPGGRQAECWQGIVTVEVEGIFEREDGAQMTLSKSILTLEADVISEGDTASCAPPVLVDINACPEAVPEASSCNPYCQLGCPAGEHCVVSSGFLTCAEVGLTPFGQACAGHAECAFGLSCMTLPGRTQPTCQRPCSEDIDCPTGAQCSVTVNLGAGVPIQLCGVPSEACELFGPPSCSPGLSCYYDGPATQCLPAGELQEGAQCDGLGPNACLPGLACLVACQALCSDSDPAAPCAACPQGAHIFDPERGLGTCLADTYPASCDLFSQGGCDAGEGCYPVPGGVGCREAGALALGQPCIGGDSCQPGLVCVGGVVDDDEASGSRCLSVCDISAAASVDQQCISLCPDTFGILEPISWGLGVCYPQ